MPKAVESTLAGQPDKMCDQIADAIVDEYLRRDPKAQVDINVLGAHGMLMIAGEVDSTADFDCGALAAQVYKEIGYAEEIQVFVNLGERSPAMKEARARPSDTVVLTGYATRETREMLPRALVYAHTIARRVDELRNTDPAFQWLMPDGKVQLVMEGARVQSVTVLASHRDFIEPKDVEIQCYALFIEDTQDQTFAIECRYRGYAQIDRRDIDHAAACCGHMAGKVAMPDLDISPQQNDHQRNTRRCANRTR